MTSRQIKAAQLRHRMAIQAMPPHRLPKRPTAVERHMADTAVDMLVLIVGMKAGASNMSLSRCCGVALYPSGFVKPLDQFAGNVRSGSERIFYAGTVTAPKNIGESINEAVVAAREAARAIKE